MITKVSYNGIKTSVFISHETVRKDFVIWSGFTLVGVYKSLQAAKTVIESNIPIDGDISLLSYYN